VLDQIEYVDHLVANSQGKIRNPAGLLITYIRENNTPPESFQSSRQRKLAQEAEDARYQAGQERARLELAYDRYLSQEITRYIDTQMGEEAFQKAMQDKKQELRSKVKPAAFWNEQMVNDMARSRTRADVAKRIAFLTFEAFCQEQQKKDAAPPQPELGLKPVL
jgi:hypothetical protein